MKKENLDEAGSFSVKTTIEGVEMRYTALSPKMARLFGRAKQLSFYIGGAEIVLNAHQIRGLKSLLEVK